jgi:thiosulfate/3-mercaptopyruvate sulfurtransferase
MADLIEASELARLLETGPMPVLADVRWTLGGPPGLPDFERAHLPGAQYVDLEQELSAEPGEGGRHPLPAPAVFQQAMRRIGVNKDSVVVVYDGGNALAAARLWWMLTDAGHTSVRVLNGGVAAWAAASLPLETGAAAQVAPGDFVAAAGHRSLLGAAEVAAMLGQPSSASLIDVRAADRYAGESEPIDPVAGHIPGAINLPSMANIGPDGRFLEPAVIAARYAEVGQAPVVYCGSGITAAHTLLALYEVGVQDAAIYAGSWSDWITDPSRPVATGRTP